MGKVFLKDGTEFELSLPQSLELAKQLMLLPHFKKLKIGGHIFCWDDIDFEAFRKSRLPQQVGFGFDVPIVPKKSKKSSEKH